MKLHASSEVVFESMLNIRTSNFKCPPCSESGKRNTSILQIDFAHKRMFECDILKKKLKAVRLADVTAATACRTLVLEARNFVDLLKVIELFPTRTS